MEPWRASSLEGGVDRQPEGREMMFEQKESFCNAIDNVIMHAHDGKILHAERGEENLQPPLMQALLIHCSLSLQTSFRV